MNWTVLQGLSPEITFEDYHSIALYLVRPLQIDKLFHGPTDPKISKKKLLHFKSCVRNLQWRPSGIIDFFHEKRHKCLVKL